MKPIIKVFLVIGALVLSLVVWGVVFNDGGVIQTAWNAMVTPINNTWASIVGDPTATILPTFEATGAGGNTRGLDVDENMGN